MECKRCHKEIADDSVFCEHCGKRVRPNKWLLFLIIVLILLLCCGGIWVYLSCRNEGETYPEKVTINVSTADKFKGTVSGAGSYFKNDTVEIIAIANEGCRFVSWNDGNPDSIRQVIAVRDTVYEAQFDSITKEETVHPTPGPYKIPEAQQIPKFTITVKTDDPNMGTVKGGGEYDSLAEIKIEAQPKNGYQFVSWTDGNKNKKRTIKVTSSQTFVATFREKPSTPREEDVIQPSQEGTIQINWNGVATYNGPGQGGTPHGVGGKLVFYKDYQLDLKHIDGKKLDIKAGDVIEDTKFKNGKLFIGIGTLHRKDGTTHPIM